MALPEAPATDQTFGLALSVNFCKNALGGFTGAILLTIFALLAAKYAGLIWMDPVMGLIGAYLVSRWFIGLITNSGHVLLDKEGPQNLRSSVREPRKTRIIVYRTCTCGPSVQGSGPPLCPLPPGAPLPPDAYKQKIPKDLGLVHVTIEVNETREEPSSP